MQKEIVDKAENKCERIYNKLYKGICGDLKYNFTPTEERWDVEVEGNRVDELKFRNEKTYLYMRKGYIFEKLKYEGMKNANADKMYYICFFNDGFTLMWDVTNINPKWIIRKCTPTTAEGYKEAQEEKVPKVVTDLEWKDAIVLFNSRRLTEDEKHRAYNYLLQNEKKDKEDNVSFQRRMMQEQINREKQAIN